MESYIEGYILSTGQIKIYKIERGNKRGIE